MDKKPTGRAYYSDEYKLRIIQKVLSGEMSKEGAQILLNKIEGDAMDNPGIINLNTKLIIRDSVKKIN